MNLTQGRYTFIRNRLIELYNVVNNRTFGFWISPEAMMTLDELRERSTCTFEGSIGDSDYFSTPQLRRMRLPQLIDYLPTMRSHRDLGIDNANQKAVEIYESVQEYIALWCEIMRNAPQFKSPHLGELESLENLAFFMFPHYKKIKPYRRELDARKLREDRELENRGLAGFAALFTYYSLGHEKGDTEISFISYLDNYRGGMNQAAMAVSLGGANWDAPRDSAANIQAAPNYDPNWAFRG